MSRHTEPPAWSAAIAALGVSFQKMQDAIDNQALTIEEKDGIIADQAQRLDEASNREERTVKRAQDSQHECAKLDEQFDTAMQQVYQLLDERETLRARIRELTDRLDGTDAAAECEDWVAI